MLARSVVGVGVCANATVASNADAVTPAVKYLASMCFLPDEKLVRRKHPTLATVPK
jgi:hypothetical protein